jgi:hypothetical protein
MGGIVLLQMNSQVTASWLFIHDVRDDPFKQTFSADHGSHIFVPPFHDGASFTMARSSRRWHLGGDRSTFAPTTGKCQLSKNIRRKKHWCLKSATLVPWQGQCGSAICDSGR